MRRSGLPPTQGRSALDTGKNHGGRGFLDIGKTREAMLPSPSGREEMMRIHQRVGEPGISAMRGEHQLTLNERKVQQMRGSPGVTIMVGGTKRDVGILEMKEHLHGSRSNLENGCGFRRRQVRRRRRSHAVANLDLVQAQRTESQREINESKKRVINWHPPQSRAELQRPRRLQRAMRGACHAVSHSIENFNVFLTYQDDME